MSRLGLVGAFALAITCCTGFASPTHAANQWACIDQLTKLVPDRRRGAPGGSAVMRNVMALGGPARDAVLVREIMAGNMPAFMRELVPVSLSGRINGREVEITICVTPDYLAVGDETDFVRVPLGMSAAARLADELGFMLPTAHMVDLIYEQAEMRLPPEPMEPGAAMTTTRYFMQHNVTVTRQADHIGVYPAALVAGTKKDLVISERLRRQPNRVAIYGWHRNDGDPIQPLSLVHEAEYADYSHGVRLVSRIAFINGRPVSLAAVMQDPDIAGIVTGEEGQMYDVRSLLASLYQ
ncbi:MAG: hypothetical protein AAF748_00980 [Pseudomonadota bacterium]